MSDSSNAQGGIAGLTIAREDHGDKGQYTAKIDGARESGKLTWVKRMDGDTPVRVAEHTIVPREIGGKGVAAQLVDALVDDAREHGFKIDPQCSYVAEKFDDNPVWHDLRA
ncbi:MAG: GNAT family N-acetyltransferase [Pontixanthobacter sp.]